MSLIYNSHNVRGRGTPVSNLGTLMHTYNVEFQSQSFKIMTEHDSKIFENLRSEVEKKLKEVQLSYNRLSIEKALFLTCLHFAEDKFLLKKAIDKNITNLEAQAKSILTDLESSPKEAGLEIIA